MNKVIKKMWKKAEKYADTNALLTDELKPMTIEHFAKLIVKECMEWCDAHATIDGSAQQIRNSIKNYFGVEE